MGNATWIGAMQRGRKIMENFIAPAEWSLLFLTFIGEHKIAPVLYTVGHKKEPTYFCL